MIRLFLLGSQDARGAEDGSLQAILAQPKRFALLAYLAVEAARGPRRRDELLALFWPEADTVRARRALTYALYFLRRELGQDVIARHGADDLIVAPNALWTDVGEFEQAVEAGRFDEALALYRGDFMSGFYDADAPELEQWADARRLRLRERARTAAWGLVESAKRAGAIADGVRWTRRALELAPDDERAFRELATFLHAEGDVAGMNAEYEHFVKRYEELHGTGPSGETRRMLGELRATRVPATPRVVTTPSPESVPTVALPPDGFATPAVTSRPIGRRPRWLPVALSAAALMMIGIAYAFGRTPSSARTPTSSVVAVVPFAYHGTADLSYTSDGVATLLAAALDRAGGLRAVNPRVMLGKSATTPAMTPDEAASAVQRYGAGEFVLGDITESGRRLRIAATLYDSRGRAVQGPIQLESTADSLFELVDRLAARVIASRPDDVQGSTPAELVNDTRSIPALRAFLDGERDFRAAQYDAAMLAYRRATVADSNFALAFLRMSQAANWTGDFRLQLMADERAQQLRDRLSRRDRMRADAWNLMMIYQPERAESLYKTLVAEDPTDVSAWYYLADLVYHQGPRAGRAADESRPSWQRVLALDPNDASALIHLARLDAASHDSVAFDSLSRHLAQLDAGEGMNFELRALHAYAFGDSAERAVIVRDEKQRPSKQAVEMELAGHLTGTSYDAAGLAPFWAVIDNDAPNLESHGVLLLHRASVELARGHLRAASALIDTASVNEPSMSLRYRVLASTMGCLPPGTSWSAELMKRSQAAVARGDTIALAADAATWRALSNGLLAVRRGDVRGAARASASLDDLAAKGVEQARQLAPLLRGEVTNMSGRSADALAALGPSPAAGSWIGDPSTNLASANERWLRAELLARVGREREALRVFASIPDVTGGDVAYAPAAHLREGELLEQLGSRDEAAAQYRRALAYWRDADAELAPLVKRASDGLARVSVRSR